MYKFLNFLSLLILLSEQILPAAATNLSVKKGESIQAVIDKAADGDIITISSGTFKENIDFKGKKITVRGQGVKTIIRAATSSPVVSFTNNETAESILDSVTITGGMAVDGAGILISGSSPTIVRNIITRNKASSTGSGISIQSNSSPKILNNIITYNTELNVGDDPHQVQINNSSPQIINNTITYGDSNGILANSGSTPNIENNIIAFNGSNINGMIRGRGICDFSTSSITKYNLFFMNVQSALLFSGMDFQSISEVQTQENISRFSENLDGNPRFRNPRRNNFTLINMSAAIDKGNPFEEFNDRNNTRNDIGFTGGPNGKVK